MFYGDPAELSKVCPVCGEDCWRDSVDIGVGIIYGPWGCPCGWSESDEYNQLIEGNQEPDRLGGYKDQWGGYHPVGSPTAKAYRMADARTGR